MNFNEISIYVRLVPFIFVGFVISLIGIFQRRKEKDAVKRSLIYLKFATVAYGLFIFGALLNIPVTIPDKRDISVIEQRLSGDEHQRQAELDRQQINRDAVHELKVMFFFFLMMTGGWSVNVYKYLKLLSPEKHR
jgi:hypothetical protein